MVEKKAAKKEKPATAPTPAARKTSGSRDIGIDVPLPDKTCTDEHCPFHGKLSVRGQILEGVVVSIRMQRTAVVEREYLRYLQKFERFEKRTRRMNVHAPACLGLSVGDRVTMMECRPLAKTVHFVAVRNQGVAA
ncbi:MAG TPA: 30S ribosomal protein S17 [Thermoplasmata archaeon]|nr:30S ribosomal protein S17 [Thermoplasmata archaeon]